MKSLSVKERRFHLQNFVNKVMLATMGLSKLSDDECKKMVTSLIQMGKLTSDEGERLLGDLSSRVKSAQSTFEKRIDDSLDAAVHAISVESQKVLNDMGQKVQRLEKQLNSIVQRRAVNH